VKPIPALTAPRLALLERLELPSGDRSDTAQRLELPPRLWQQALLGPLHEFLSRPGKASRARLVELAYDLAGGAPGTQPPELPLLVESLHAGSLIIDDIEDESEQRRGAPTLHRMVGVPVALNTGNWLYFHALDLLCRMRISDSARLLAFQRLSRDLLRCHEGQALDLTARVVDLSRQEIGPVAMMVASCKSGGLLALGMALAAIAADAPKATRESLANFGEAIGIAIQMLDDLSGIVNPRRRAKAIEDLRLARPTFVWAWLAQDADDDVYRASLARLVSVIEGADPEPLIEALRFRVAITGRSRARCRLRDALATLRHGLGVGPLIDALERQLGGLERLYLESDG
jgi:geranylgeranyl pyrophosphate synthase